MTHEIDVTGNQRILIVDDERLNLNVLAELLKPRYRIYLAKNGTQALERAVKQVPDLILLDVMMPDMDGYEVIRELKRNETTKDIPVIFVSALSEAEDEEKGLLLGAVDYIAKPFSPVIVKARVRNHLKIVRQRKLLESIALIDGLTEIPNRRSYIERRTQEWKRSIRTNTPFSLGMIDVDCFKQYNDHYGHSMGDDALKAVASTIQRQLRRPGDFVARFGGEEFVFILPETDAKGATMMAEKIRAAVEELAIEHAFSQTSKTLTISIGGMTMLPGAENMEQAVFQIADQMLYRSKNQGRNQVSWQDGETVIDIQKKDHCEQQIVTND